MLRLYNVGFEQDQPVFRPVLLVVVVVVVVVVAVVVVVVVVVVVAAAAVVVVVSPTLLYPSDKIWVPGTITKLRKMHNQTCFSNAQIFGVSKALLRKSHSCIQAVIAA